MFTNTLAHLLITPLDGERSHNRMRRWLNMILAAQLLSWAAVAFISPARHIQYFAVGYILLSLAGLLLVRRGYLTPVRLGLPLAWYVSFALIAQRGDGLHDLSIAAFPVLAIFPVVLLGRRAALLFTLLSSATMFWLAWNGYDAIHAAQPRFMYIEAALLTIIFSGTMFALWAVRSSADEDLARVLASERETREAKEQLELRNAELHAQQEALTESERRYRLLADHVHDVVWLVDLDFEQVYCSPSVVHQRGYTPEELAELTLEEQICPDYIQPFLRALEEEMRHEAEGNLRRDRMRTFEYKARCKDGREIWLETVISGMRDESGKLTHFLGVARDVTERKHADAARERLERQIQQMQKLESLGLLAGGIAHDFNNILLGIMGNADLALMKLPNGVNGREHLEQLIASAGRAADLCKQLLAYSGKGRFVVRPIDLSEIVRDMTALLEVSNRKNVSMRYQLEDGLPAVEADATQVRQIVMNLVLNAVDAVGERPGTVTVATGSKAFSQSDLSKLFLAEELAGGRYVYLEVSDTGAGMDSDTQKRIFDPFFTTKPRGHGLGLAAVLGIVRGHGGGVKVYSEPGQGTCIRIYFPASDAAPEAAESNRLAAPEAAATGTILVVDDEQMIRDFARDALELRGYSVMTAENGEEAVALFKERNGDIKLVLLDVAMPVMNGEETFRELRRIRPDVRAILSSGFSEQDAVAHFTGRGLVGFLHKPYLINDLYNAVETALETDSKAN